MRGMRKQRRLEQTQGSSAGCRSPRHTLSCLRNGQSCIVVSESLPRDLAQKLFPLGLEKEALIEVLSGGDRGPYLIRTGGTRIMLDWETVRRIPVKERGWIR